MDVYVSVVVLITSSISGPYLRVTVDYSSGEPIWGVSIFSGFSYSTHIMRLYTPLTTVS